MGRIRERLTAAQKALATLEEVVGKDTPTEIERDAAIQRFEYSFETTWKAAQAYLRDQEFLQTASPKSVIRESFNVGLLSEDEARHALAMANDRNLTAHTYNENLAQQIYERLSQHAKTLSIWLHAIEERME